MTATTERHLAAVDVTSLQRTLDGRRGDIRRQVRDDHRADWFTPRHFDDTEAHRAHVFEQMKHLSATGHPLISFPSAYGGQDDVGGSVTAYEMLGYGDLSLMVKSGVQWGLFGGAVQALGTERHHDRYLRSIMDFSLPGCFAMTETEHGSDVQGLLTTATYDPASQEFVIHTPHPGARKDYIGSAARDGRLAVVFAQLMSGGTSRGVHALLVPIRDDAGATCPGVRITDCGPKAGLNGVDNGRVEFDHVRVPREALLNRYADVAEDGTYTSPIESPNRRFFTMLGALVRGRVSIAGAAGTAARTAVTVAVRHGDSRRQFVSPTTGEEIALLDYLSHQRKLLPALARSYALGFAQEELVALLHDVQTGRVTDEETRRRLEADAAGIKAATTWHAVAAIQDAREACGGWGYLTESRLPALRADTDIMTTFEGDNTVLMQLVAKAMLTGYRQQVSGLDRRAMARLLARRVVDEVAERTAVRSIAARARNLVPGRGSDADLFDRRWQLALLQDREDHSLAGLADRLRGLRSAGGDAFAVANRAQDHMQHAAGAHVDLVVLLAFSAAIDRCTDPAVAELLDAVCDLFVLSTVEADLGWFLTHNRLRPAAAKAVTAGVDALCGRLRPHAASLVEAFGIDDAWLPAAPASSAAPQPETPAGAGTDPADVPAERASAALGPQHVG